MPDTTPASPERTVVTTTGRSRLVFILTIVNSAVLALIILGAIIHHHRMKREHEQGFAGRDRNGGAPCDREGRGGFERFHHFRHFGFDGGPGRMGPPGAFGEGRFDGGPDGGFGPRPGMERDGMGMHHGGMGPGMAANPERMTDAILQHLTDQLSLTDDEKAKIKPLVQADVTEMQKNAQAMREAMQKQFEDTKAKIRPLLNADQQKELDAVPAPGPKPADDGGDPAGPPSK